MIKIKSGLINKIKEKTIKNDLFIMESFFFIGYFIIVFTNFAVNTLFGLYFLGFTFIAFSIFLFKFRK